MYHLKFYADCPDGLRNKLFCYSVHDGKHAADLLSRFKANGFGLRAAFIGPPGHKGQQITKAQITFISNLATISSLYVKYPPRAEPFPTPDKGNQLAPGRPSIN